MARAAELREMADEELIDRLEGNKEELFNLRFQLATGQLDDPNRIKDVRHDIARVLTVLRERHIEAEVEAEVARADAAALEHGREARAEAKVAAGDMTEGTADEPLGSEEAAE